MVQEALEALEAMKAVVAIEATEAPEEAIRVSQEPALEVDLPVLPVLVQGY